MTACGSDTEQELRRSEAYLAEAQRLSRTGSFGWCVTTGKLIWSAETFCIMGYDRSVKPTLDLVLQRVHSADLDLVQAMIKRATRDGAAFNFEHRLLMPDGTIKHVHVMAHPSKTPFGEVEFVGAIMDVTARKRAAALVEGEKRLLEMIARGTALESVLEELCRFGEEMSGDVLVSILLLSADGKTLRHGAAPSLPKNYTAAIDGALIGPEAGSCGTAAYRKERVIVCDIGADPLWKKYRGLALPHGLRACWSTPIFSTTREVMGTFALYSREPCKPSAEQLNLIEQMTHLAAVAIERKRAAEALQASEHLASGQLEALAHTVDAMAQETDPDKLLEHALRTIVEESKAQSLSVWQSMDGQPKLQRIAVLEEGHFVKVDEAKDSSATFPGIAPEHPAWGEMFRTRKHAVLWDIDQTTAQMCVGSGSSGVHFRVLDDSDPNPGAAALKKYLRGLGVKTILFVPMLIAGELAGIVGIRFMEKRSFRQEEIELTQALANQAMLAIQLTRLSQQSRDAAVIGERNRMARDIHDTLAQGFTGVIMQLEAVKGAIAQKDLVEASERVERAGDMARVGLGEARRSVLALRPHSLQDKSLCLALDDLFKRMTNGSGLQAEFYLEGAEPVMRAEWEEILLRIAQESLTNTIKHAKAKNFRATLKVGPEEVQFRLADDGVGFNLQAEHEGFGLLGMKERVDQAGGQFILRSMPGQGTEIQVVLKNEAKTKSEERGNHA